jgi:hypothetical protein
MLQLAFKRYCSPQSTVVIISSHDRNCDSHKSAESEKKHPTILFRHHFPHGFSHGFSQRLQVWAPAQPACSTTGAPPPCWPSGSNSWETHGKTQRIHQQTMGSTWENHGKTTGDSCETLMGDVFKMIYK